MRPAEWRIEHFRALASTQDELRSRLIGGDRIDGLVLRADVQSDGRGQRARDWASAAGGSWQSAALKGPALPAAPLFIALGIAGALNSELPPGGKLQLKWPNDLLQSGLKVGGILCEVTSGHLLCGVGVNVDNQPPAGAGRLAGLPLSRVHSLVLDGIGAGWRLMTEHPEQLQDSWAGLDALQGRQLQLELNGEQLSGKAAGIDGTGRLRLLVADGELLLDSAAQLRSPLHC